MISNAYIHRKAGRSHIEHLRESRKVVPVALHARYKSIDGGFRAGLILIIFGRPRKGDFGVGGVQA